MGGKAVPNHPDYLTRTQASEEIAKALTGSSEDKIKHIAYRRIGEYKRSGELPSEPIVGGKTRQFHKNDLFNFALKVFGEEIKAFKIKEHQLDKQNEQEVNQSKLDSELLADIGSTLHLYERNLLDPVKTIRMIQQIVEKFKEEQ